MRNISLVAMGFAIAGLLSGFGITIKNESSRKLAPDFVLNDQSGNPIRLSDYKGKVVVLNFWATWCGPCKAEIPWFIEFANKYKDEGLAVIGVSMDEDEWTSVRPFMEKYSINYPVVMGTKRVASLYGDVDALPVTFFLDRELKVAAKQSGGGSRKQFEQTIKTLLGTSVQR